MPLTLNGSGGITYPDGTTNATRSVSAAGDTMTGGLSATNLQINNNAYPQLNFKNNVRNWVTFVDVFGGAGGRFIIKDETANLDRVTVDASGRVTMPYQPAFLARSNYSSGTGPSGVYVFSDVVFNVGGHYSTSNGRFTAPVAGVYEFHGAALSRAGAGINIQIRKNAAVVVYGEDTRTGSFGHAHIHTILQLSVGDYVDINCNDATYGNLYDYFCGRLVS